MTACRILWEMAGSPTAGVAAGHCAICGVETYSGIEYRSWQGANFTDQNKMCYPSGTVVCSPCVWAHAWSRPPGLKLDPKKKRGPNVRMFSHVWSESEYWYGNKAAKPELRDRLRVVSTGNEGRWFAAIADSGQKHILPWTPVNPGRGGIIRFEERDIVLGPWELLDTISDLLSWGVTKAELETGEYRSKTMRELGRLSLDFEAQYGPQRHDGWFILCLWLAQRNDEVYKERTSGTIPTRHGLGGFSLGRQGGVPGGGREAHDPLDTDSGDGPGSGSHGGDGRGVVHPSREGSPARGPVQGTLFGD